jgi:hypothetical protein
MLRRFIRLAAVGAAVTVPVGVYAFVVRPWAKRWGVDATEAATVLPGDDILPDASTVETRAITIDAAPADVWPWLVQMGYGRAGFYSYDHLDTKAGSADEIVPAWQDLKVGDTLPTHPAGGFEVRVLEPEHALVVYVDNEMAKRWTTTPPDEASPVGVQASGAFLGGSMPTEFAGTWAFKIAAMPDGRTRLIERLRFRFPDEVAMPARKLAMEALGFGVFLMVRKQLLGIRDRAEKLARTKLPVPYVASPFGEAPTPA